MNTSHRRRLAPRSGFTLLEVMVALTITALVATLAAAALRAATDVRERVQLHRTTADSEARMLSWLATMLRHPPAASAVDEALLTITQMANGSDSVTFLSQGVDGTAGVGPVWRVSIVTREDGLHLHASPINRMAARVPLESVLPHVGHLSVQALESNNMSAGSAQWRADWPVIQSMPRALRVTLLGTKGEPRTSVVLPVGLQAAGVP